MTLTFAQGHFSDSPKFIDRHTKARRAFARDVFHDTAIVK
jgi:hypothetical protein